MKEERAEAGTQRAVAEHGLLTRAVSALMGLAFCVASIVGLLRGHDPVAWVMVAVLAVVAANGHRISWIRLWPHGLESRLAPAPIRLPARARVRQQAAEASALPDRPPARLGASDPTEGGDPQSAQAPRVPRA